MKDSLRWFEENREDLLDFLSLLVKTQSLSGEEEEISNIISGEMETLGYRVTRDEMGNLIARIGKGKGKTTLFDAHMDHVKSGDLSTWSYEPYNAEINDGIMYGRGTVDMKGALAAIIYGCAIPDLLGEIIITCVVHEETNEGVATKKIIEDMELMPDSCVLGEPTNLKLSIGQRGRAVFKAVTRGATSHASMPELGKNAIYLMNPVVKAIEELNKNLPSDPFLGKGSISITEISCKPGGGPIIPDQCSIIIDRRTIPGESLDVIHKELEMIAEPAKIELLEDEITCYTGYTTSVNQYFPGWVTDKKNWVVKKGLEALKLALNEEPEIIGWKFSTNGVATSGDLGIPTIGFGPGDPSQAHQPNEHIRVDDVVTAAKGFSTLAHYLT